MQANQIVRDGYEHSNVRLKAQKMIKTALKCLNLLVELCLLDIQTNLLPQDQRANIGARHYYIGNLVCVQNVNNRIKYPGQWELFSI